LGVSVVAFPERDAEGERNCGLYADGGHVDHSADVQQDQMSVDVVVTATRVELLHYQLRLLPEHEIQESHHDAGQP